MAGSYGRKHESGMWMVAICRNAVHSWVYNCANRLRVSGSTVEKQWSWWSNQSLPDGPSHPLSLPFSICVRSWRCSTILSSCSRPTGAGRSFVISLQHLTHPALCGWASSFEPSVAPHTPGPTLGKSHVSVTFQLPWCRTVTWPSALPQAFGSSTKAALHVVSVTCAHHFLALSQIKLPTVFYQGFLVSWGCARDGGPGEETGSSVRSLPCLSCVHSLHLCASASLDL